MDDESTTERPTEPMPTAPGHYPRFLIIAESVSSTDSIHENQATPAPPVNLEDVQASCCVLFSCRRSRSVIAPVPPAMPLSERAAPTTPSPAPPVTTPSHMTVQNVLDLPAVAGPSLAMP
ncbi:hypothetical protein BDN67DRAFT_148335 [Paxillus ammoniavirescens]|nr:hypothetical protein BDN67DRAFT_148335 [Paxillus ammoniavirescens]